LTDFHSLTISEPNLRTIGNVKTTLSMKAALSTHPEIMAKDDFKSLNGDVAFPEANSCRVETLTELTDRITRGTSNLRNFITNSFSVNSNGNGVAVKIIFAS
jgi:hypothetical protein